MHSRRQLSVLLLTLLMICAAQPLAAATIIVDSLDDNMTVNGQVTLREAVKAAVTDASVDGSTAGNGPDTIVFHPSLDGGTILWVLNEYFTFSGADIVFDASLLPLGITIDCNNFSRFMSAQGNPNLEFRNITMRGGYADATTLDGGFLYLSSGELTLRDCRVIGNAAEGSSGAFYVGTSPKVRIYDSLIEGNSAKLDGGALKFAGGVVDSLVVSGSVIVRNTASKGGGFHISGATNVVFTDARVDSNTAESTSTLSSIGGAIYNESDLELLRTTLNGNQALPGTASAGFTGGLYTLKGTVTLDQCEVRDNTASDNTTGGGLYNAYSSTGSHTLTVTNTTISGNFAGSGSAVANSSIMSLTNCQILDNVTNLGSAVSTNLLNSQSTIASCTFSGNAGEGGGAVSCSSTAVVDLQDCLFENNTSTTSGGAVSSLGVVTMDLCTFRGNSANTGDGGGFIRLSGDITMTRCTFDANQADRGGAVYLQENFGGIASIQESTFRDNIAFNGGGALFAEGAWDLSQCTLSGNTAGTNGGAIHHGDGTPAGNGLATIKQCTISGNTANVEGGGIMQLADMSLGGTIISGNTGFGGVADIDHDIPSYTGSNFTSLGFNLVGDNNLSGWNTNDQLGILDPLLGVLQDNGGPTETMAVLPGSPAIDGSSPALYGPFTYDQRGPGFSRVLDGDQQGSVLGDIGAFEFNPVCTGIVTSLADGNLPGQLRYEIACASSGDIITFTPGLAGGTSLLSLGQMLVDKNLTLDATDMAITLDAQGTSRIFEVAAGATVEILGLKLTGGAETDGAAIMNQGNLTLQYCAVTGNQAAGVGGGIFTATGAVTTLTRCEVSGNTAASGGAGLVNSGTTTVTLCTLAGNAAGTHGGGVSCSAGSVAFYQSTVSGNSADQGGGLYAVNGTITVGSSIVSGNSAVTADGDVGKSSGSLVSLGNNLIGDTSAAGNFNQSGDMTGVLDPRLNPLQNNGGSTRTMSLLLGSAALDAGNPAACGAEPTDQRGTGYPRGLDGNGDGTAACDIGAFESGLLDFGIPITAVDTTVPVAFYQFAGAGFTPDPATGQIDSDGIIVQGVSDEVTPMRFGDTADTGDYARGDGTPGATVGGIFGFQPGGNRALGFSPSTVDLTPGSIYLAYQNLTGVVVTSLGLTYELSVFNSGDRANIIAAYWAASLGEEIDPGALTFNQIAGSPVTSPSTASAAPVWATQNFDFTITGLAVPPQGCIYLEFRCQDIVSGATGRDDFALDNVVVIANPASVSGVEPPSALVGPYRLGKVHPNPFNPRASFELEVKRDQRVTVAVYDLAGRRVQVLHEGMVSAGVVRNFTLQGNDLGSGIYFIRAVGEDFTAVRKATVLK